MTQPNPTTGDQQGAQQGAQQAKRFRPGQVVSFRFRDVFTGLETAGHALVLRLLDDLAHLAVLGTGGHVQVHVDDLAPAKVDDVPNPLPAPEPEEGASSSS